MTSPAPIAASASSDTYAPSQRMASGLPARWIAARRAATIASIAHAGACGRQGSGSGSGMPPSGPQAIFCIIVWLGTVKTRSSSARRAAAAAGPATSQQPLSASAEHATSICMASVPLSEQLRFIGKRDGRPGFDVTCLGFGAATISNHRATRPAPQQPQCAPPGCAWP